MSEHEEYLELCTAFLTDCLTSQERSRLEQHLASCSECRAALTQYQAIVRKGLPGLAPKFVPEVAADQMPSSVELGERRTFARLALGDYSSECPTPPNQSARAKLLVPKPLGHYRPSKTGVGKLVPYAAGILLMIGLGISTYRLGVERGNQASQLRVNSAGNREAALRDELETLSRERDALNSKLQERDTVISELEIKGKQKVRENAALELSLRDVSQQSEVEKAKASAERNDLNRELEQAEASSAALQKELDTLKQERRDDAVRVVSLEGRIDRLADLLKTSAKTIRDRDVTIEEQRQLLAADRDIRKLMGARDLYIAEVYDVAGNGKRKKPYGRVFYTRGKSLIFYAYDLDLQPGVRSTSAFQAWGQRGPDRMNALNLGILYVDNTENKRWVLRFDNPRALEQINAVFVTVEQNGGSRFPTGKPLLFAYLREEPNHP